MIKSTTIIMAALIAVVFASVFVYYPLNVTVSPTSAPVVFQTGTNAGGTDLGGNTITVSLGSNAASADITVHPTYQTTYYEDVLRLVNTDSSTTYYVTIRVNTAVGSGFTTAKLIVNGVQVDLTATGDTTIGQIPASGSWQVDLQFVVPEGSPLPSSSTASIQVIYSPSSGTPP